MLIADMVLHTITLVVTSTWHADGVFRRIGITQHQSWATMIGQSACVCRNEPHISMGKHAILAATLPGLYGGAVLSCDPAFLTLTFRCLNMRRTATILCRIIGASVHIPERGSVPARASAREKISLPASA